MNALQTEGYLGEYGKVAKYRLHFTSSRQINAEQKKADNVAKHSTSISSRGTYLVLNFRKTCVTMLTKTRSGGAMNRGVPNTAYTCVPGFLVPKFPCLKQ